MEYNKRQFTKSNDKRILHKVKKQWVVVSMALLMAIGGGAVVSHVSARADANNNQPDLNDQLNQNLKSSNPNSQNNAKLSSKAPNSGDITSQAQIVHDRLIQNVSHNAVKAPNLGATNGSNQPAKGAPINVSYINESGKTVGSKTFSGSMGESVNFTDNPDSNDYSVDPNVKTQYTYTNTPQNVTVLLAGNPVTESFTIEAYLKNHNGQITNQKDPISIPESIKTRIGATVNVDPHTYLNDSRLKGYVVDPSNAAVPVYMNGNGNDSANMVNADNLSKSEAVIPFIYDEGPSIGSAEPINVNYYNQNGNKIETFTLYLKGKIGQTVNVEDPSINNNHPTPAGYVLDPSSNGMQYVTVNSDNPSSPEPQVDLDFDGSRITTNTGANNQSNPLTINVTTHVYSDDNHNYKSFTKQYHPQLSGQVGDSDTINAANYMPAVNNDKQFVQPQGNEAATLSFTANGPKVEGTNSNEIDFTFNVYNKPAVLNHNYIHYVSTSDVQGGDIKEGTVDTTVSDAGHDGKKFYDQYYLENVPSGYEFYKVIGSTQGNRDIAPDSNDANGQSLISFSNGTQSETVEVIPKAGNMTVHYVDQNGQEIYRQTLDGEVPSDQAFYSDPNPKRHVGHRSQFGKSEDFGADSSVYQNHVANQGYHLIDHQNTTYTFDRNSHDYYVVVTGKADDPNNASDTANVRVNEENPNGKVVYSYSVPDHINGKVGDSFMIDAADYLPNGYRIDHPYNYTGRINYDAATGKTYVTINDQPGRTVNFYYKSTADANYKDLKPINIVYIDDGQFVGRGEVQPSDGDFAGETLANQALIARKGADFPANYTLDDDQTNDATFSATHANNVALDIHRVVTTHQGEVLVFQHLYHGNQEVDTKIAPAYETNQNSSDFTIDPNDYQINGYRETRSDQPVNGSFTSDGVKPSTVNYNYQATNSTNGSNVKPEPSDQPGPHGKVTPNQAQPIWVQYYDGPSDAHKVGSDVRVNGYMDQNLDPITNAAPVPNGYQLIDNPVLNYSIGDQVQQVDLHVISNTSSDKNYEVPVVLETADGKKFASDNQEVFMPKGTSKTIDPSDYNPDPSDFILDDKSGQDVAYQVANNDGVLTPASGSHPFYYIIKNSSVNHGNKPGSHTEGNNSGTANNPSNRPYGPSHNKDNNNSDAQPIYVQYRNALNGQDIGSDVRVDGTKGQEFKDVTKEPGAEVPSGYHLTPLSYQYLDAKIGTQAQQIDLDVLPNATNDRDFALNIVLEKPNGMKIANYSDNVLVPNNKSVSVNADQYNPDTSSFTPLSTDQPLIVSNHNGKLTPANGTYVYIENDKYSKGHGNVPGTTPSDSPSGNTPSNNDQSGKPNNPKNSATNKPTPDVPVGPQSTSAQPIYVQYRDDAGNDIGTNVRVDGFLHQDFPNITNQPNAGVPSGYRLDPGQNLNYRITNQEQQLNLLVSKDTDEAQDMSFPLTVTLENYDHSVIGSYVENVNVSSGTHVLNAMNYNPDSSDFDLDTANDRDASITVDHSGDVLTPASGQFYYIAKDDNSTDGHGNVPGTHGESANGSHPSTNGNQPGTPNNPNQPNTNEPKSDVVVGPNTKYQAQPLYVQYRDRNTGSDVGNDVRIDGYLGQDFANVTNEPGATVPKGYYLDPSNQNLNYQIGHQEQQINLLVAKNTNNVNGKSFPLMIKLINSDGSQMANYTDNVYLPYGQSRQLTADQYNPNVDLFKPVNDSNIDLHYDDRNLVPANGTFTYQATTTQNDSKGHGNRPGGTGEPGTPSENHSTTGNPNNPSGHDYGPFKPNVAQPIYVQYVNGSTGSDIGSDVRIDGYMNQRFNDVTAEPDAGIPYGYHLDPAKQPVSFTIGDQAQQVNLSVEANATEDRNFPLRIVLEKANGIVMAQYSDNVVIGNNNSQKIDANRFNPNVNDFDLDHTNGRDASFTVSNRNGNLTPVNGTFYYVEKISDNNSKGHGGKPGTPGEQPSSPNNPDHTSSEPVGPVTNDAQPIYVQYRNAQTESDVGSDVRVDGYLNQDFANVANEPAATVPNGWHLDPSNQNLNYKITNQEQQVDLFISPNTASDKSFPLQITLENYDHSILANYVDDINMTNGEQKQLNASDYNPNPLDFDLDNQNDQDANVDVTDNDGTVTPSYGHFYFIAKDNMNSRGHGGKPGTSSEPNTNPNNPNQPNNVEPVGPATDNQAQPLYLQYRDVNTGSDVGDDVRIEGYLNEDLADVTKAQNASVPAGYHLSPVNQDLNYRIGDQEQQINLFVAKNTANEKSFPLTIHLESSDGQQTAAYVENVNISDNSNQSLSAAAFDPNAYDYQPDTNDGRDADIDLINQNGTLTPSAGDFYYTAISHNKSNGHGTTPGTNGESASGNQPSTNGQPGTPNNPKNPSNPNGMPNNDNYVPTRTTSDVNDAQPLYLQYRDVDTGSDVGNDVRLDGYLNQIFANVTNEPGLTVPKGYHLDPANQTLSYKIGKQEQQVNLFISKDNADDRDFTLNVHLVKSDGTPVANYADSVYVADNNQLNLDPNAYNPNVNEFQPDQTNGRDAVITVANENGTLEPTAGNFYYVAKSSQSTNNHGSIPGTNGEPSGNNQPSTNGTPGKPNLPVHHNNNKPVGPVTKYEAQPIYLQYRNNQTGSDIGSDVRIDGYLGQDFTNITNAQRATLPKGWHLVNHQNLNYSIGHQEQQVNLFITPDNVNDQDFPLTIHLEDSDGNPLTTYSDNIYMADNSNQVIMAKDYNPNVDDFKLDTRYDRDGQITIANQNGSLTPASGDYYYVAIHKNNENNAQGIHIQLVNQHGQVIYSGITPNAYDGEVINNVTKPSDGGIEVPSGYNVDPNQNLKYKVNNNAQNAMITVTGKTIPSNDPNADQGKNKLTITRTVISDHGTPTDISDRTYYIGGTIGDNSTVDPQNYVPAGYHLDPTDSTQSVYFNPDGTITPNTIHFVYDQNDNNSVAGNITVRYINQAGQQVGGTDTIPGHGRLGEAVNVEDPKDGGETLPNGYYLDPNQKSEYVFSKNAQVANLLVTGYMDGNPNNQKSDTDKNQLTINIEENGKFVYADHPYVDEDVGSSAWIQANHYAPKGWYSATSDQDQTVGMNYDGTITPQTITFNYVKGGTNVNNSSLEVVYVNQRGQDVGTPSVFNGPAGRVISDVTNPNDGGNPVPSGYMLDPNQDKSYTLSNRSQLVYLKVKGYDNHNSVKVYLVEHNNNGTTKVVSDLYHIPSDQDETGNVVAVTPSDVPHPGYHTDTDNTDQYIEINSDGSITPESIIFNYDQDQSTAAAPILVHYIDRRTGRVVVTNKLNGSIGENINVVTDTDKGGELLPNGYQFAKGTNASNYVRTFSNYPQSVNVMMDGQKVTNTFVLYLLEKDQNDHIIGTATKDVTINNNVGDSVTISPYGTTDGTPNTPSGFFADGGDHDVNVVTEPDGSLSTNNALFTYTKMETSDTNSIGTINVHYVTQSGQQIDQESDHGPSGKSFDVAPYEDDLPDTISSDYAFSKDENPEITAFNGGTQDIYIQVSPYQHSGRIHRLM